EDDAKRATWTVADDKLLASAYTMISQDPTTDNSHKSESFWKQVVSYYNANRDSGSKRRVKTHSAAVKKDRK
ncbi:hypothetical protein F511_43694, partial [Dorcoceras hygrometricum]